MSQLYILFEHASGYALFTTSEFEELSVLSKEVQDSLQDVSKFRGLVQLVAFKPFKTSRDALENMNCISEGILHEDLQLFLETNLPKPKKKKHQPIVLGVGDPKLSVAIVEALGFQCQHTEVVPEILRGIRQHFLQLVGGFTEETAKKSQLALALNYSRAKVKFNINRVDNMVIQSIALIDQLDKDLNTFTMRIREWYSFHFPELFKVIPENVMYAKVVSIIKDRNEMNVEEIRDQLEEVVMDSNKVDMILEVARTSMGMDISAIDLINIENFCCRVVSLVNYRMYLMQYLKDKMSNIAPNLSCLIGESVGARLISQAGSLTNLAKHPASTVQILGAEKALFRALKTKGNTPKYGLIFHSTFIGKAAKQNKGRISRYLANKCSIASRIDCFSEVQSDVYGKKLKQQVEDRLKFYDTGDLPPKNLDIMTAAAEEASVLNEKLLRKKRKLEKKERKQKEKAMQELLSSELQNSTVDSTFDATKSEFDSSAFDPETSQHNGLSPKKKKKKLAADDDLVQNDIDEEPVKKKKKKKRHNSEMEVEEPEPMDDVEMPIVKKKKKKSARIDTTV